MFSTSRQFGSLALAVIGFAASGGALAQGTWDLDACARAVSGSCTSGGSTVSISGFYSNGNTSNFQTGTLNIGTSWMGVKSKNSSNSSEVDTSPHHAIDNFNGSGASYAEGVYLNFTEAVDLSSIAAVWSYDSNGGSWGGTAGYGDFQLYRWVDGTSGPGSITGFKASSLTGSGWAAVSVTNGDFGTTQSQSIMDGTVYSSHWLVTTKFGGSNDAFKLGTVNATNICKGDNSANGSGACVPDLTSNVPEPASLALFAVAALGAGAARRRALAKKA